LIRAITMGIDAGGNRLGAAMPRYQLTAQEASSLVAWLKAMDDQQDPGVTDDAIVVGVLLPPETTFGGMNRALRETLTSVFAALNEEGGLYGRKIVCRFAPATEANNLATLETFLDTVRPFALLECYIAGDEREIGQLLEQRKIPLIQPVTLFTGCEPHKAQYVFHLDSGMEGQMAALMRFAMKRPGIMTEASFLVVDDQPPEGLLRALVNAAGLKQAKNLQLIRARDVADWTSFLSESHPQSIFWMTSGSSLEAFLAAADRAKIYPLVFVPGALSGPRIYDAPRGFGGRLFLAFPSWPADQSPQGQAEYHHLAEAYHFSEGDTATRLSALCAGKLLIETLRKTGREVTREKIVKTCEQFYQLDLGSMRPVSFAPDRRVGSTGAHIVGVDLEKRALALPPQWVECDLR
jgi:ABC-type branched-subunit amino acid transport system substrate-binding protein